MQLEDFISHFANVKGGGEQFTARCPAHSDHQNSLSIGRGSDGRILLHCHAGCSVPDVLSAVQLPLSVLFSNSTDDKNFIRTHSETNLQNCNKNTEKEQEEQWVTYPYHDLSGNILFEVVRKPNKQFLQRRYENGRYIYNLQNITPVLYHLPLVRKTIEEAESPIFVCEGEKDADKLVSLGYCATTAPMGAGKWRDSYTKSLLGAGRIIILPDNDVPGRKHALDVGEALEQAGIQVEICDLASLCPSLGIKGDVSDVLNMMGDTVFPQFLKQNHSVLSFRTRHKEREMQKKEPAYQIERASDFLRGDFLQQFECASQKQRIPSGFEQLDAQMEGEMYAGLYVIGSVSSLGKTAFCLQMADHIAHSGFDVLFFTLEMSKMEMVARSLARTLFEHSRFQSICTAGEILSGRLDKETLHQAMDVYEAGPGGQISFVESGEKGMSADEVAKLAFLHKEATGKSPVIFVDYLQILRTENYRMSDKQAMDYNVTALKRLSRQLDRPVVTVSSFNRQNYSESVNFASFKESGAIEYSADVILGLQARGVAELARPDVEERKAARIISSIIVDSKKKDPRPVEVVTLKNRRGPAWNCFGLDFYPKQNYFLEV